MPHNSERNKSLILDAVVEKLKSIIPSQKFKICAEFITQFFGTLSSEDLIDFGVDDLFGAALNFWHFFEKRNPEETKILIYNPNNEHHYWHTSHTVVQVLCPDRPFLVDTLRIVINRMESALHLVVHMGGIRIIRDEKGDITEILARDCTLNSKAIVEAPIFIEIDRQTDPKILDNLITEFKLALNKNAAVVEDWHKMRSQVTDIIQELASAPANLDIDEVSETKEFLQWIEDDHFTLLGMRDYELVKHNEDMVLKSIPETSFGVLREEFQPSNSLQIIDLTPEARELILSRQILVISKTNTMSTVHRYAYPDYIGVKRFNSLGEVIGERRILGLYTFEAYNTNPRHIPFLRHKVAAILNKSGLHLRSHAGRVLLNIIETLPRDDLIQGSEDELLAMSMGIYHMQERRCIRLFHRIDLYHRFISCLVYLPKDLFTTELRRTMQLILMKSFNATDVDFSTYFGESALARIHFIFKIDPKNAVKFDFKAIEQSLIEAGRSWFEDLQNLLFGAFGEEKAKYIFNKYRYAIPTVYTASFSPKVALSDIRQIEEIFGKHPSLGLNFSRPLGESPQSFRLKIYQNDLTMPLSEALPIIENLGLKAISERPYIFKFADGQEVWINDFSMSYANGAVVNVDEIKELFQNAFSRVWFGEVENDGFNQLVLSAGLNSRQVVILRMYAKYFKQIGFTFSQEYIEKSLAANFKIAKKLVNLFEIRFDPEPSAIREENFNKFISDIEKDLDTVTNLDDDKIIHQYIFAIKATLRTNYYQLDYSGRHKSYISIKLHSKDIPFVPKPYPMYEIFVYSPRFEAVHLRCSKVARGGLRWSDRREDFRTEILGLMKAQQVKNAVIVPNGAKGGFILKKNFQASASREEILAEGISCYKKFMRALLDITDNYVNYAITKPKFVVTYDEDDPYLVVAADKGTATFSDIANSISEEYGFWLGDAFASGGSAGYDHKKMGITARGAWESVNRHLFDLGINIDTTDFTVVGIGDMAGDVFGNGMLLSKHIKLVAAFNHMHIFLDPAPDAALSFKERKRLFNLPSSTWDDYDKKLISPGGGVFKRNLKNIPLSSEMQKLLNIKQTKIEPNALIKLLLQLNVDLLWSAGIGTFVKGSFESAADVGDKANDALRINGSELKCKAVVEGGNLGLTQLGRVEYALAGGRIYTDFIDNSAGVNCSDKEVNTKILINKVVNSGDMTVKQRNELLTLMTDNIAKLVLRDNYLQTLSINLSVYQAVRSLELHTRLLDDFEATGKIDRNLEYLPDRKTLMDRKLEGKGLTSPEISVLLCYCKTLLRDGIIHSSVPEDIYLHKMLIDSFPKQLQEKYQAQMSTHPLKREIIATKISNLILSEMTFSFIYRVQDETGASVEDIVRAYLIAREIMHMDEVWKKIDSLDNLISSAEQMNIMINYMRLLRRFVRWFLKSNNRSFQELVDDYILPGDPTHRTGSVYEVSTNPDSSSVEFSKRSNNLDITTTILNYSQDIKQLRKKFINCIDGSVREYYTENFDAYIKLGLPEDSARLFATDKCLLPALDIAEISHQSKIDILNTAKAYFSIGEFLSIGWIRTQIIIHKTENHWESLARESLRDDFDWHQRQLTLSILNTKPQNEDLDAHIKAWAAKNTHKINRWNSILANLKSSSVLTFTMFFVAIRELLALTHSTF